MTTPIKEDDYGHIVTRTQKNVVRMKVNTHTDDIQLYIHKVKDGIELLPNGYMLGYNYLRTPEYIG